MFLHTIPYLLPPVATWAIRVAVFLTLPLCLGFYFPCPWPFFGDRVKPWSPGWPGTQCIDFQSTKRWTRQGNWWLCSLFLYWTRSLDKYFPSQCKFWMQSLPDEGECLQLSCSLYRWRLSGGSQKDCLGPSWGVERTQTNFWSCLVLGLDLSRVCEEPAAWVPPILTNNKKVHGIYQNIYGSLSVANIMCPI